MTNLILFLGLLLMVYYIEEKHRVNRARKKIPHVVHVNGTRGKSTVCRLIAAGLRADGKKVICKTTGTDPMISHVDGRETLIRRIAPSNIREQMKILCLAASEEADILVVECMAITPELQRVSQQEILQADVAVITNVRRDHTDVMGNTLEDIADALSLIIPEQGICFTAEQALLSQIEKNADRKNCPCKFIPPMGDEPEMDFEENLSLAAAVCEKLGVKRQVALEGMRQYSPDPYALCCYQLPQGIFVNAMAANDPTSTEKIIRQMREKFLADEWIILCNNRGDRPERTRDMAKMAANLQPDQVWVMQGSSRLFCRILLKNGYTGSVHTNGANTLPLAYE